MVESPIIVDDESDDVVEPSVVVVVSVSVFFELQDVVRAIIAMKKKADFVIAFICLASFCLSETYRTMSLLILHNRKGNPVNFNFFLGYVGNVSCIK